VNETFKIYVDRLRGGSKEIICETCSPEFLEVSEKELFFKAPVFVEGEAYLVGDNLFVDITAKTVATVPCSVCNGMSDVDIVGKFTLVEGFEAIKTGVYTFVDELREALLLEVPLFAECCKGECPERKAIQRYLKNSGNKQKCEGQRPFAEIL
jgi:hypothetical protein